MTVSTSENDERLIRIEQSITANTEQMAWMISWLDKKFGTIDQRFETMESDLRCHIDLRHEEMRSDFRAFREMQKSQAERIEKLEIRVDCVEDDQRVMSATLRKRRD